MPGIQPQTYITRVTEHSDLSPQALLVALTIAQLRFKRRLKPHEPLPMAVADLAKACHLSPRGICRYLDECIRSGWVMGREVYRDGRQKPNEYFLADPTDSEADCRRVQSEIASGGKLLTARVARNCDMRLHTVLRSKNNGAGDDAAPRGGVGSDGQGQIKTAPPAPPRQAGTGDAQTEALARQRDQERQDAATEALAYPAPRTAADYLAADCPDCAAPPGLDCRAVPPPGHKLLAPSGERPRIHFRRMTNSLASVPA